MINTNSNLPNMSNTIKGWFLNISFEYVERYQQGADWIEGTPQIVNTKGVVRPPSDEDLKIYRKAPGLGNGCKSTACQMLIWQQIIM